LIIAIDEVWHIHGHSRRRTTFLCGAAKKSVRKYVVAVVAAYNRAVAEPGSMIGPYRLVAPLGRGAMGEVWKAKDERLDRYVAVKVLPVDHAGDTERRARMLLRCSISSSTATMTF
jgi:serine/threonine protein kinase